MTQSAFGIWIAIIGGIGGLGSIAWGILEKEEKNRRKKGLIVIAIIIFTLIIGSGIFMRFYEFKPENIGSMSESELIKKGEDYYLIGDYLDAIKIYNSSALDTNSVALSNLAYMYENGMGVKKDVLQAKEYYLQAKKLGSERELDNWIAFNLKYPTYFDELLEYLREGYECESLVAIDFISKCMSGGEITSLDKVKAKEEATKFFEISDDLKRNVLEGTQYEQYVREEDYSGIESEYSKWKTREENMKWVIGTVPYEQTAEDGTQITLMELVQIDRIIVKSDVIEKKFCFADDIVTQFLLLK